jgi:hypothetical protein
MTMPEDKDQMKSSSIIPEDFEQIAHTGGKISFGIDGTMTLTHQSPNRCAWIAVRASYNGIPLQHVPMVGMGMSFPIGPEPSILVYIGSDREGFFGRKCPACKGYFRVSMPNDPCYCTYCGQISRSIDFMSVAQLQYIGFYVKEFIRMLQTQKNVIIDLDKITNNITNNRSELIYAENRQQTLTKCESCNDEFDILGSFGYCPSCGKRNSLQIFLRSLLSFSGRIENPIFPKIERDKREAEWKDIIVSIVSEFDGLGNDIKQQLLKIPCTTNRKKETEAISFQSLISAQKLLLEIWGIDLFDGISEDDLKFVIKMFQKRHLYIHRAGIVDQEYLDKTHDSSVRIGQKIRLRSAEAKRFLTLMTDIGKKLFINYESLFKS